MASWAKCARLRTQNFAAGVNTGAASDRAHRHVMRVPATGERSGGFRFDRKVGEHILHQRLILQQLPDAERCDAFQSALESA